MRTIDLGKTVYWALQLHTLPPFIGIFVGPTRWEQNARAIRQNDRLLEVVVLSEDIGISGIDFGHLVRGLVHPSPTRTLRFRSDRGTSLTELTRGWRF
jgi:hypothetical protein